MFGNSEHIYTIMNIIRSVIVNIYLVSEHRYINLNLL